MSAFILSVIPVRKSHFRLVLFFLFAGSWALPISENGAAWEQGFTFSVGSGNPVIVPQPAEWKHGSNKLSIDSNNFQFLTAVPPGPDLKDALDRYTKLMFPHASADPSGLLHESPLAPLDYSPRVGSSCVLVGAQLWVADNHAPLEVS